MLLTPFVNALSYYWSNSCDVYLIAMVRDETSENA